MDREIKVTKCEEVYDCDDRISIEFSPTECMSLKYIFENRAVEADTYTGQTAEREFHDVFLVARGKWEKARKEKEEQKEKDM